MQALSHHHNHRQHVKKDTQASRLYPTVTASGTTKWVTRDIAALDFLLGIPMERQAESVRTGWERHNKPNPTGKWWERDVILNPSTAWVDSQPESTSTRSRSNPLDVQAQLDINGSAGVFLERPLSQAAITTATTTATATTTTSTTRGGGRRLDGDSATKMAIPLTALSKSTRQRYIARQAQVREWERHVVSQDVLSARIFFSAKDNYPVSVFSVIKYEPKREEAARRRQKLEACGGGGTQFVVPPRDWRGTSYRALLPRQQYHNKKQYCFPAGGAFNRLLVPETLNMEQNTDDENESYDSNSSDEDDTYVPGFLDDPEMRQGRHRHVMIGDRFTGCIVSSTIQFVKPDELKADLNKQFRERFDGWEPPQSQRKYIGAKIIDGVYTLLDPHEIGGEEEVIRMPPSLTLSKIRSAKQQIILAAIHDAHLEVSTVALSFVYFERLCLDCRVDKSNRRLSFAACLLLAAKINESKITLLVHRDHREETGFQSLIRPTREASTIFASLLEFFTHDWGLSLKHLFSAEWGVFAALGFRLHATPAQVQFHFRRIMKVLGWNALAYLGHEMYTQWQDCLETVDQRERERVARRELRREQKERNLLKLELQRQIQEKEWSCQDEKESLEHEISRKNPHNKPKQHMTAMKLIHRLTSSLARPSPVEPALNLERLQLPNASESTRTRRSETLPLNTTDDIPLSLSPNDDASQAVPKFQRSSSMPVLVGDQLQTLVPTSPREQHLTIEVGDCGSSKEESDCRQNLPAHPMDCDEESNYF